MNSSASNPKLPNWAFITMDAILVVAAWYIGSHSKQPLSVEAIFGIVGCLVVGAIVLFVPIVAHFERQKNEALDERQRALESLARTVAASAEQISIAAAGLHEIAEIAQKNLRHAEQLPHKLQEKMAEFQSQLANANDTEKDELEKELAELRSADSERLQSVSDKIARSTAEWVKLEAATHQHLNAASEAIAKLSRGTADAIGKAQAAAEQALAHARTEAARAVGDSSGHAIKSIDAAKSAALAELTAKIEATLHQFDAKLTRLEAAAGKLGSNGGHAASAAPAEAPPAPEAATTTPIGVPEAGSETSSDSAPAPKRNRRPRRDDAPATAPAEPGDRAITAEEPPPVPPEKIPEVSPVTPSTAEPFSGHIAEPPGEAPASAAAEPTEAAAVAVATETVSAEPPKSARKRAPKKPEPEPEPALPLDDSSSGPSSGVIERVLSSDGATRLLVTAYIGIGNRLFIRGEGAGLAWDKGVPLQFVSIGKWRWETNEASAPVQFKLFKNDDVECTALGTQSLEPGHQQEVMAAF